MQRSILRGSIIVQYIMEFYKYIFEVENNTMIISLIEKITLVCKEIRTALYTLKNNFHCLLF